MGSSLLKICLLLLLPTTPHSLWQSSENSSEYDLWEFFAAPQMETHPECGSVQIVFFFFHKIPKWKHTDDFKEYVI